MKQLTRSWMFRAAAWTVVHALVMTSIPVPAFAAPAPAAPDEAKAKAPEPPKVRVNRTVPPVTPPKPLPSFSAEPTEAEIFRARVLEEPLVPSRPTTSAENKALADALTAYIQAPAREDLTSLEGFLRGYPDSAWKTSLLLGMGIVKRRTGHYSKALASFEEAWQTGKDVADVRARESAYRAAGEMAALYSRLGRTSDLEALFAETDQRPIGGSAAELIVTARQALGMMKTDPGRSFRCGPLAVQSIYAQGKAGREHDPRIERVLSTAKGTSLAEMHTLFEQIGMSMRMAKRDEGADLPLPALVHWRAGHYAALLRAEGGKYLVKDPTFGDETWVSLRAIDDEASGYFLIPQGGLKEGWREVSAEEGNAVWGKGVPYAPNPQNAGPTGPNTTGGKCPPMATYAINQLLASLYVTDRPVSYTPPRGPAIDFSVHYNQRDIFQPQLFYYSNLGPKWTFNWISYIEDDPDTPAQTVTAYLRGGGQETYSGYDGVTKTYQTQFRSHTVLTRTSASQFDPTLPATAVAYVRELPDGSKEIFYQPDGSLVVPRKVFLSQWRDAQDNTVKFTYDSSLRLVAISDAIGQVTVLSYDLPGDPLKVTKVTDPFGRFATFEYSDSGRLSRITDVIGITSEFVYEAGDFISELTTPYGTTHFRTGTDLNGTLTWIEATDPLGGTERLEYVTTLFNLPAGHSNPPSITDTNVPSGFELINRYLTHGLTAYWDKRAAALNPLDYNGAVLTTWLSSDAGFSEGVTRATKKPLESRVWYRYGDSDNSVFVTSQNQPSQVARLLDDGSSQIYQSEYNTRGRKAKQIDPLGRETDYFYGTNNIIDPNQATGSGIDLLQVKQKNGTGGFDIVETRTYDGQHQLAAVIDAAGQETDYTYLPDGRLQTVKTPARDGLSVSERTTTYAYYPDTDPIAPGRLQSVTQPNVGAAAGPSTTITYDIFGRVRTATQLPDNYATTTDYDTLDRPVKVSYPDGTFEQTVYNRLDAEAHRDRLGRWSHTFHDALRRVTATRDPLGRTVTQVWCNCGSLEKLIDAKGNATTWERDIQGRATKESWPDGKVKTYVYEGTTSRLKSTTDPKGQTILYGYDLDDKLVTVIHQNAAIPTPDVTYSYRIGGQPSTGTPEPYGRMTQMTDGTGVTTYAYNGTGALGANQLQAMDGPLANDVIAYTYDEMGRVKTRTIDGSSQVTWLYDSLGRLKTQANALGTFTWGYDGVTGRVATLDYPSPPQGNGQQVKYTYFDNVGDRRLQEILNWIPSSTSTTISKFDYTYDKMSNISTWQQQAGAASPNTYTYGYDAADQLTMATLATTDANLPKRYGYSYDAAGNRTGQQIDDTVTGYAYDNRNRLTDQGGGQLLRVLGTVNEPATVSLQAVPVPVTPTSPPPMQQFQGDTQRNSNQFTIVAKDASGNTRTNVYSLTSTAGAAATYKYDDNGNLCSVGGTDCASGTTRYEWDAENRLVDVKQGASTLASFVYSGTGSRYQRVAGGITHTYVIDGRQVVQERLSSGGTISFFDGLGIDQHLGFLSVTGAPTFYASDHLGSIRQTTNGSGAVTQVRDYDPYGSPLPASPPSSYAFTGREWDSEVSLYYYRARYYAPAFGRFLSEDTDGVDTGRDLYVYVDNNPLRRVDPTGHQPDPPTKDPDEAARRAMRKIYRGCKALRGLDEWQGSVCRCESGECMYTDARLGKSGDAAPPCPSGAKYLGFYHCHSPDDVTGAYFSQGDSATVALTGKWAYLIVSPGLADEGVMKKMTTAGQTTIGRY